MESGIVIFKIADKNFKRHQSATSLLSGKKMKTLKLATEMSFVPVILIFGKNVVLYNLNSFVDFNLSVQKEINELTTIFNKFKYILMLA